MKLKSILVGAAVSLTLLVINAAIAHDAAKGRNGGMRVDAGKYHIELLADGSDKVSVFLSDADDKPVDAKGFKATAILAIDGKSQRFALEPADGARLSGTSPTPVKVGVKGVVQLVAPDGTTSQGKF